MSILHKHPVFRYKIKVFEWKTNWMKLLKGLDIKIKSLNENWNIECKWTRVEFYYILAGIIGATIADDLKVRQYGNSFSESSCQFSS